MFALVSLPGHYRVADEALLVLVPVWIPGVDITEGYLPENKF